MVEALPNARVFKFADNGRPVLIGTLSVRAVNASGQPPHIAGSFTAADREGAKEITTAIRDPKPREWRFLFDDAKALRGLWFLQRIEANVSENPLTFGVEVHGVGAIAAEAA